MLTTYGAMHHTAAMATDDLITTAEACELLGGLDRSTISRWVQIGKLRAAKKLSVGPNGAFLFDRADVEQLAEELKAKAAS